jgi:hypothetical protein
MRTNPHSKIILNECSFSQVHPILFFYFPHFHSAGRLRSGSWTIDIRLIPCLPARLDPNHLIVKRNHHTP